MILKSYLPILSLTLAVSSAFPQTVPNPSQGERKTDPRKEAKKLEEQAARLDREAKHANGNPRVLESLSKQLGVPVETLRAQRQKTQLGFGNLFIANALAKDAGKSFDQMASEFKSARGWSVVAKQRDINLGKILHDMRRLTAEMRGAHEEEMRERGEAPSKPDTFGRGGDPDRSGPEQETRSLAAGRSHRRGQ
jgi:hypothetical protein